MSKHRIDCFKVMLSRLFPEAQKKHLPSSLNKSQLPIYKGIEDREVMSQHLPHRSLKLLETSFATANSLLTFFNATVWGKTLENGKKFCIFA